MCAEMLRILEATNNLFVRPLFSGFNKRGRGSSVGSAQDSVGVSFLSFYSWPRGGRGTLSAFLTVFVCCSCSFASLPRLVDGTCTWRWCMGNGSKLVWIEIYLAFVWVVEIDLMSAWEIEIDMVSV